ncbi:MAG: hypothetical protein RL272_160 [Candidatus Parcubacteria bacterium]|jgi:poly(A) polymerase
MDPHPDVSAGARTRLVSLASEPALAFLPEVAALFPEAEWFVVGGAVRDAVIGRSGGRKDVDLVVRGIGLEELSRALSARGDVNLVGRTFGVMKFRPAGSDSEIDIAWPRTERAGMSGGYRDFAVQADPELPIERDLARRDFTMNAVAYALGSGAVVDPYGGLADIAAKTVRAVGAPSVRFAEDHSRMLRAVRFACELGFAVEGGTWDALRSRMPHLDDVREIDGGVERVVPYETAAKEFVKAMAADPARAVDLFSRAGALARLIPELSPLRSCAQPPDHHSEGDAWTHTTLALSKLAGPEFAGLFPGEAVSAETAIAVLLHDVAKPHTSEVRDGRITFYGHAERGAAIAEAVASRLRLSSAGIDVARLGWLVRNHLFPNLVDLDGVRMTTLRKYFLDDPVAGRSLLHLACADAAASLRPDGSADLTTLARLLDVLRGMAARAPEERKPLLSGDEVMSLAGIGPGPEIGRLLEALGEAQLRGEISSAEEAALLIRAMNTAD